MQAKRTYTPKTANELMGKVAATEQVVKPKSKVYFLDPNSRYPRLKATYPFLDTKAFKTTMDNYEEYKDAYNESLTLENKLIAIYNDLVTAHLEAEPMPKNFAQIIQKFEKDHQKKNTRQYNGSVEKMNNLLKGDFLKKKKIPTIKDASTRLFYSFLCAYNKQLKVYNLNLKQSNQAPYKSLVKLDINSGVIKSFRNGRGGRVTNLSTQSIRNHRMRLEEAGVLVERTFHGYERGVRVHINNQILVVFDDLDKKYTCFDNQVVKQKESEKLIVNNIITINKYNTEYKEKIRSSQKLTTSNSFITRTPNCKEAKKAATAKNYALNNPKNSEDFKEYLIPTNELATKLAAGYFISPPEVDFNQLAREAAKGSLSREEFSNVLINYFFMYASKIYKDRNATFGSWRIAIEMWQKHRFRLKNGQLMHKDTMIQNLYAFMHGIKEVSNFCRKNPEYRTLYPNQYFDLQRKDKKSGGFEFYARAKWVSYLDQQERIDKVEAKQKDEKQQRLLLENYNRRFEKQVRKWLNGKMSYEALTSYAAYNLPQNMQKNLGKIIADITDAFNIENAA